MATRTAIPAFSVLLFVLAAALGWAYWPTLCGLEHKWATAPHYSHGYLVAPFSVFLLWLRWQPFRAEPCGVEWLGVLGFIIAAGMRLAAAYLYFEWLDGVSLLVCVAALFALWRGWAALVWVWPAIAFLIFMIPLPYRLEIAMAYPLQHVATVISIATLQTLGYPAVSEATVILVDDLKLEVAEACSGLSILMMFFSLSTAVALVVERSLGRKILLTVSAIPIALVANVLRVTVTVALHASVGGEAAHLVFHDLAGWIMMPLAMGLLMVEVALFSRLFRPVAAASNATPARAQS